MCYFFVDSIIALEENKFIRVNMNSLLNYMHSSLTFRVYKQYRTNKYDYIGAEINELHF